MRTMRTKGFLVPNLPRVRAQAGWSQQELADEAGLLLRTVVDAENGHGVYPKTIKRFVAVLHCAPHDLLKEAS